VTSRPSAVLTGALLVLLATGCGQEDPALVAARSFDPDPRFNREFWNREQREDTPLWNEARALCSERFRSSGARTPTCKELEIARLEAIVPDDGPRAAPLEPAPKTLDYSQLLDRSAPAPHSALSRSSGGRSR